MEAPRSSGSPSERMSVSNLRRPLQNTSVVHTHVWPDASTAEVCTESRSDEGFNSNDSGLYVPKKEVNQRFFGRTSKGHASQVEQTTLNPDSCPCLILNPYQNTTNCK